MASFKPKVKKSDSRYAMPLKLRKWTRNEDHVLRAVALSCHTVGAFSEACEYLCRVLNRQPMTASDWGPSHVWWRTRRIGLIRNRLWDIALRYRDFVMDPVYRLRSRANQDWNIIEIEEFLRKFHESHQENKPKTIDHLAIVLSRENAEVHEALDVVSNQGFDAFFHQHGINRSLSVKLEQDAEIEASITEFLKLDLDTTNPVYVQHVWIKLNKLLDAV